jgi:hypothetical protein
MRSYRNVRRIRTRASLIAVIAVAAIAIPAPTSGASECGPDPTDVATTEIWVRYVFPISEFPAQNQTKPRPVPAEIGMIAQVAIEASCPITWSVDLILIDPNTEGWPTPDFCCEYTSILVPSGTVSVTITEEVLRAAGLTGFLAGGGISTPSQFPPDFILDPATGTLTPA